MAYRDELEAARLFAERLEEENRALREHLSLKGPTRSRVGASIAMLCWTLVALSARFLGIAPGPDDTDVPTASEGAMIGDVVTPAPAAPGADWGDVRTISALPR